LALLDRACRRWRECSRDNNCDKEGIVIVETLRGVVACPVTAPSRTPLADNEIHLPRARLVAVGLR
jgi:hypothetical protein